MQQINAFKHDQESSAGSTKPMMRNAGQAHGSPATQLGVDKRRAQPIAIVGFIGLENLGTLQQMVAAPRGLLRVSMRAAQALDMDLSE